jgi:hypothetical protein
MAGAQSAFLVSRRGTPGKSAPHGLLFLNPAALSGERGLADRDQQVIADGSDKHIVLILEPSKLSF